MTCLRYAKYKYRFIYNNINDNNNKNTYNNFTAKEISTNLKLTENK